jgi:diguanylate cyclase (GGDEF)-like protein
MLIDADDFLKHFYTEHDVNTVLIIDNNPQDIAMLQELLTQSIDADFKTSSCNRLDDALDLLLAEHFDMVFLNLSLPDSSGVVTFTKVFSQIPDTPIIVLTDSEEQSNAVKATQLGAKDYVIKGETNSVQLKCSVRYAIEQQKIQNELSEFNLIDNLTGTYTRQSFIVLLQHYLRLAYRTNRGLIFVYINIHDMDKIMAVADPQARAEIITSAVNILRQTFRRSDIISRFADAEFAIIALETKRDSDKVLTQRLFQNLKIHNSGSSSNYNLSFDIGTACYDPKNPKSISELIAMARRVQCVQVERKKSEQHEKT